MGRKVRAVLFDFDGVLADTGALISDVASRMLREAGVSLSADDYDRQFHGVGGRDWRDAIVRLSRGFGFEPGDDWLAALQIRISNAVVDGLSPTPGIVALWDDLSVARGVVSSCPRGELLSKVQKLALRSCSALVAAEDVVRVKPDPEPYRRAAALLGVECRECVVIEDSSAGIASAKGAGALAILLCETHPTVSHTDELIASCAPDRVARSVRELREILSHLGVITGRIR